MIMLQAIYEYIAMMMAKLIEIINFSYYLFKYRRKYPNQLGTDVRLDYDSTKLKEFGSYYKKYETNIGKGFVIAKQDRSSIFSLGYFTDDPQKVINEQLIKDLYSSINIPGIIKATYSNKLKNDNVKSSSNSKDDSQSENFLDFCKNSNLGDLSKDVAELCIEKLNKK